MNPVAAQRLDLGAIGALITLSLINLVVHFGFELPQGYLG